VTRIAAITDQQRLEKYPEGVISGPGHQLPTSIQAAELQSTRISRQASWPSQVGWRVPSQLPLFTGNLAASRANE
jgi:hypothetical protein